MTTPIGPLADAARTALDAFLRQVERRAAVFAELLCGDADRGDDALARAMRAFRNAAARGPIDDWTQRFWSLLLAVPQLRAASPHARWPAAMALLARLPTGLRAAMLLRLVAGLDDAAAAAALGLALPTYRDALERAWPRRADGSPDADAWRALAQATHWTLQQLPATRLVRLARLREHAIQGHAPAQAARRASTGAVHSRRRWQVPALLAASAAGAIALAATFFLPAGSQEDDFPLVRTSTLPAAALPAATYDGETALLTHPDFDQLADTRDAALIADLDFYAWYAARLAAQPGATATPLVLPDAGDPLAPEVRDAP
jgi:hypothetical protein